MGKNKEGIKEIYDVKTWLQIHISQLTYVRNLIIIISTAEIGFLVNILMNKCLTDIEINFGLISLTFGVTSIIFGFYIAYHESENFRLKGRISRQIIKGGEYMEDEDKCTKLERGNKIFFKGQLLVLSLSLIFLSLMVFSYIS